MSRPASREAGFTLLEQLLAATLMALVASLALVAFQGGLDSHRRSRERADRLADARGVRFLLQADLERVLAFEDPGFQFAEGQMSLLVPNGADRLDRITYRADLGTLTRAVLPAMSEAGGGPSATVLDGVAGVRLLYRRPAGWTTAVRAGAGLPTEIRLEVDWDGTSPPSAFDLPLLVVPLTGLGEAGDESDDEGEGEAEEQDGDRGAASPQAPGGAGGTP